MLNITTFLDANSKRLNKNVLFNPKNGEKYTSKEILSIREASAKLRSFFDFLMNIVPPFKY